MDFFDNAPKVIDYGKLMNTKHIEIVRDDGYSPNVPKYFTGVRNDAPVLNGQIVSVEEFNNHEGITEQADDTLVKHAPLQVGSDYDKVVAVATPATIVDMIINGVVFSIPDTDQLRELINILNNYKQQMEPYKNNVREVGIYIGYVNQALLQLGPMLATRDQNEANFRRKEIMEDPNHVMTINEMMGYF